MKKVVFLIISLFIFTDVYAQTSTKSASFVRCVDGDTAVFMVDGQELKFRFLAIDTPETVHPTKEVEAFGSNASEYTCNKLTNAKEIVVEYEESNKIDKYDRHLAWIWVDGSMLQKELVDVGYAEVAYIYGDYRYTESLCLAQKTAKEEGLGLWVDKAEEGYCSSISLEGVENNIIYENINVPETDDVVDEEKEKAEELEKTLDNIANTVEKYLGKDNSKIYLIGFLIAAAGAFFYKEFKK